MDLCIKGNVALVIGGSTGIGLSIASLLLEEGCTTIINSRSKENLEIASEKIKFDLTISADISKPINSLKTIEKVILEFGKLDILVFCIGSGKSVPKGEETYEEWLKVFNTNFFSATNIIKDATTFGENLRKNYMYFIYMW